MPPSLTPEVDDPVALLRVLLERTAPLSADLAATRRDLAQSQQEGIALTLKLGHAEREIAALKERTTALWEDYLQNKTTMDQLRGMRDKIWALGLAAVFGGAAIGGALTGLVRP